MSFLAQLSNDSFAFVEGRDSQLRPLAGIRENRSGPCGSLNSKMRNIVAETSASI